MAIEPLELLKRVFPSLNDQELAEFIELAQLKTYPPNTVLCHEGAYEHVFYLISEGSVVVTKRFNERDDLVLRHAGPGEFFGEMAIIQNAPRSATITTLEQTTVIELDEATLYHA